MSKQRKHNIMQSVFAHLRAHGPCTIHELSLALRFDHVTIERALRRLRVYKAIKASCEDDVWRYSARPSTDVPEDRRGLRKVA